MRVIRRPAISQHATSGIFRIGFNSVAILVQAQNGSGSLHWKDCSVPSIRPAGNFWSGIPCLRLTVPTRFRHFSVSNNRGRRDETDDRGGVLASRLFLALAAFLLRVPAPRQLIDSEPLRFSCDLRPAEDRRLPIHQRRRSGAELDLRSSRHNTDRGSALSLRRRRLGRIVVRQFNRGDRCDPSGLKTVTVSSSLFIVRLDQTARAQTMGSSPDRNRSPRPKGRPAAVPWSTGADLLRGNTLGTARICPACIHGVTLRCTLAPRLADNIASVARIRKVQRHAHTPFRHDQLYLSCDTCVLTLEQAHGGAGGEA